jgi:hypothetical protein
VNGIRALRPASLFFVVASIASIAGLAGCGSGQAVPLDDGPTTEVTSALVAPSGAFSTFTYNVAGLPQVISSAAGDRGKATELISCYLRQFDFVNVQEDFNYHAALYDSCDDHPFRSPTSGGAVFGSGLNSLSRFAYMDWDRVKWSDCNGVDCLTPKGFTIARTRLAEGVFVDIYNLHTQAQTADADLSARRKNILQLLSYIEANSAGHAVIVMGDTNTRFTRAGDNIGEFGLRGFQDVWVSKVRGGVVPVSGAAALTCDPAVTSPDCEVVDKILYRDNGHVGLKATGYWVATDAVDASGTELSDHRGIAATWQYSAAADRRLSDQWGGPHGVAFNDVSMLGANPTVKQLKLRSGSRVDRVETVLTSGAPFSHGGTGGSEQVLTLGAGERLSAVSLCAGEHGGHTRVFSAKFTTSTGRTLSGGSTTSDCTTYSAPAGWQIVAFHGRSAEEVDKLGVIYAPVVAEAPGAAKAIQFVNQASGQCLDIDQAKMADGTNVMQWPCNGGANQRWSYEPATGLVRSMQDPHFCLDNTGSYANGANVVIWTCNGNSNQRFVFDSATGALAMRHAPAQAVEALLGAGAGGNVQTWESWGGANQAWRIIP